MKVIGGFLLILGIIGLLLNLVLWLPSKFNLIVMVVISVVCGAIIWGGGELSRSRTVRVKEPARAHQLMMQQSQGMKQGNACPKCGKQGLPDQRFCGACGSRLTSHCPACGVPTSQPSKFCGNCGARLG